MSKRVLILVISSDFEPYNRMIETSSRTWDSVEVNGVETIFYCSQKDNPNWKNTDKVLYFPVDNTLFHMGYKNLAMFEWALKNVDFDYVARVNASAYVDKKKLAEYVQGLPTENYFAGVVVKEQDGNDWCFGGTHFIMSKDVIQKIIINKEYWNHTTMEDVSISRLVMKLGIPIDNNMKSCSIDKQGDDKWLCISYCGESVEFSDFDELKGRSHIFYRVKQDGARWVDTFLMEQLYKILN